MKKEKKELGTNHYVLGLLVFLLCLVVGGDVYYLAVKDVNSNSNVLGAEIDNSANSAVQTGPAFDWKSGVVLNNYQDQTEMPTGWFFLDTSKKTSDGAVEPSGVWLPAGSPNLGTRNLEVGMSGDDVLAIQNSLNIVRESREGEFSFDAVPTNGVYDQATADAVAKVQSSYNQEPNSVVDTQFIQSLLDEVTNVEA